MALPVFAFRVRQTWEILAVPIPSRGPVSWFLRFEPQCLLRSSGDRRVFLEAGATFLLWALLSPAVKRQSGIRWCLPSNCFLNPSWLFLKEVWIRC